MGSRGSGRRPKPTVLKVKDGTAAKNPQMVNKREPKEELAAPQCPRRFKGETRKAWLRFADLIDQMGMLSRSYGPALECFAETYAKYLAAVAVVEREGMLVDGKRHPILVELHALRKEVFMFLTDFGLTPSAKSKIVVDPKPKEEELKRFFG